MSNNSYSWSEGYWKVIFATASWHDSNRCQCGTFDDWMRMVIESMPCEKCRTHGRVYMVDNPPGHARSYLLWAKKYKQAVERR